MTDISAPDPLYAAPLSFEARYDVDGEPFIAVDTVEFAGSIPGPSYRGAETKEVALPVKMAGARYTHDVGDDNELNTDDYTGLAIGYKLELSEDRRALFLTLIMNVQEKNSNRSHGNTRFESQRTLQVYPNPGLPGHDPNDRRKIAGVEPIGGDMEEYIRTDLRGTLHGLRPYPGGRIGMLREVQYRIDRDGRDDQEIQELHANARFNVSLEAEEPPNGDSMQTTAIACEQSTRAE